MRDERLTSDEVHAMLAAYRLPTSADSPLHGLPPARAVEPSRLRERGLLDDSWARVMPALQHPHACFRTLFPLPDRTVVRAYYAGGPDRTLGLVGCWPEPPHMRFRFPCAPADLVEDCANLVLATFASAADPFMADLTPSGLMVLLAVVDVLRQRVFEGLLRHDGGRPSITLSAANIEEALDTGFRANDARWLVTLFRLLMPASVPLPDRLSQDGLGELVRAGLLNPQGHAWRATEPMCRLAEWWRSPLPALACEAVALQRNRLAAYGYQVALRGEGPLWVFDFWQGPDGRASITLRSVVGQQFVAGVERLLGLLGQGTPAESPAARPAPSAAEFAESRSPRRASSGAAAAPTAGQAAFCTRCGASRRPGTRFCTECGAAFDKA